MFLHGCTFPHIAVKCIRLLSIVVVFKFILSDFFTVVPEVKVIKVYENGLVMKNVTTDIYYYFSKQYVGVESWRVIGVIIV
jgi:hypothetical protein